MEKRIRVAQVITSVVLGGCGQIMCGLARHVDKSRFDIDVFSNNEEGEFSG
jgi:hypothetical protein